MDIYKLFDWPNSSAVSTAEQIQPIEAVPSDPDSVGAMNLQKFLDDTGRYNSSMPGDGHSNCGFNAILEQVGDRTRTSEMINLLRAKLRYGDENSDQMFDTNSCLSVANLFNRPVVEICYNGGKVVQLSFSVPSAGLSIHFKDHELLSHNFAAWCIDREWQQDRVDALSSWFKIKFPDFNFGEATLKDVALQLLQNPTTITLISSDKGGHFDAAPHKDLQPTNSVIGLLR
jgi:hypothetical protein